MKHWFKSWKDWFYGVKYQYRIIQFDPPYRATMDNEYKFAAEYRRWNFLGYGTWGTVSLTNDENDCQGHIEKHKRDNAVPSKERLIRMVE